MRTSPVALAHLDDPQRLTAAAEAVSALTHTDERAGQACALWSHAIRHAVLEGELDLCLGRWDYVPPAVDALVHGEVGQDILKIVEKALAI